MNSKLLLILIPLNSYLLTSDAAVTEHGTEVDEMRQKLDLLSERVQTLEDKIKTWFFVNDKDIALHKSFSSLIYFLSVQILFNNWYFSPRISKGGF